MRIKAKVNIISTHSEASVIESETYKILRVNKNENNIDLMVLITDRGEITKIELSYLPLFEEIK